MGRLAISLLGPIQVTLDGERVTRFRVQAAQALLAYLVLHAGTPLRRQVLAGLLWPDHPESEALANLRQALRRLRTAIADEDASPPFLIATRTTLAFDPQSDSWLDVAAFDAARPRPKPTPTTASRAARPARSASVRPSTSTAAISCRAFPCTAPSTWLYSSRASMPL